MRGKVCVIFFLIVQSGQEFVSSMESLNRIMGRNDSRSSRFDGCIWTGKPPGGINSIIGCLDGMDCGLEGQFRNKERAGIRF